MKQCSKCGKEKALDAFPSRGNQCRDCRREAKQRWDERNREHVKAYRSQQYQANGKSHNAERYAKYRDAYIARRRAAYAADPSKDQAISQRWKDAHRDELRVYDRNRYYKNRPSMLARNRAWRRVHPFGHTEHEARRRVRVLGGQVERVNYDAIVARDQGVCHICGHAVIPPELSFDHVIPISQGGPHEASNIRVAHRSCNSRKGNRIQP